MLGDYWLLVGLMMLCLVTTLCVPDSWRALMVCAIGFVVLAVTDIFRTTPNNSGFGNTTLIDLEFLAAVFFGVRSYLVYKYDRG